MTALEVSQVTVEMRHDLLRPYSLGLRRARHRGKRVVVGLSHPLVFLVDLGSKNGWCQADSSTLRSGFGSRIDIPEGIGIEGRKINVSNFRLRDQATWISFFHRPNPSPMHWHLFTAHFLCCWLNYICRELLFYFQKVKLLFCTSSPDVPPILGRQNRPADNHVT